MIDRSAAESLVEAVECGSLSAAARRMGITQSAISLRIQRLESAMGTKLLIRSKSETLRPTDAGLIIIEFVKALKSLEISSLEEIEKTKSNTQVVKIGIQADLVHPHIPLVIRKIKQDNNQTTVKIAHASSSELIKMAKRNETDLSIFTSYDDIGHLIKAISVIWVAADGSDLPSKRPLPITFMRNGVYGPAARQALNEAGIAWVDAFEADSYLEVESAAISDIAIHALLESDRVVGLKPVAKDAGLPSIPPIGIRVLRSSTSSYSHLDALEQVVIEQFSQ